jgi:hypothetical protein
MRFSLIQTICGKFLFPNLCQKPVYPEVFRLRTLGELYMVIHKSLRDFRLLRYSSRDGHTEGKHVYRGRDTPSLDHMKHCRRKMNIFLLFWNVMPNNSHFFERCFLSMTQRPPNGQGPPHYRSFTIILRHTTLGRTPLDEWSARRRELYLKTLNNRKRRTSMYRRDSNPQSQRARNGRPTS